MKEETKIDQGLKESPETTYYLNTINTLKDQIKNAQMLIRGNQWIIKALKEKRKKVLLEMNKK